MKRGWSRDRPSAFWGSARRFLAAHHVPKAPRNHGEHGPREGRLLVEEPLERAAVDREAAHRRRGADARSASRIRDEQTELAEDLSGAQLDRPSRRLDEDGALVDDEHPGAGVVGAGEHLACGPGDLGGGADDALERPVVETGERGNAAETVDLVVMSHGELHITV